MLFVIWVSRLFSYCTRFYSCSACNACNSRAGRGSAAGSVVAYCLKITNIDPLKYDLLFERFLNPERISLPDIDIDFDDEGRAKVLDWVIEIRQRKKVAHIITYGTMAAKSSIKDVARVQQVPLDVANKLVQYLRQITDDPKPVTLSN